MKRILLIATILVCCFASVPALAGETDAGEADVEARSYPLVLASVQEATALPGSPLPFQGPLHPGLSIGTEHEYARGGWGRIFQTGGLGFYHHADLDAVVWLNSEFGYGYGFDFGLGFEALVGLGYGHSFNARPTYSLETRERTVDGGQPSILGSAALGVQYDFRAYDVMPATLFVRYQPQLQVMLASDSPLGVLPRTSVLLGTRIFFE